MKIWAIGDLHLSFGVKGKSMALFGPLWEGHAQRVEENWRRLVGENDLVLIPGDISWAMKLEEALPDFLWIDRLPGTKVMIKGNHDLWWGSLSKLRKVLPSSLHVVQNDLFSWQDRVFVAGARLWDSSEYNFESIIDFIERPADKEKQTQHNTEQQDAAIFERELLRLEESLKKLPTSQGAMRLAMTHYPPIGLDLAPSKASALFEKYQVQQVVFGHLHSLKTGLGPLFGEKNGVQYTLTSCDVLKCTPLLIKQVEDA